MSGKPKLLYENRLDDAVPVASTTASGYNVLNVRDFRAYTKWKATALPATITENCGSAKAADYALICAEPATYEVRGSTDNFGASDVLIGTITLTKAGLSLGLVVFNYISYQYWRFRQTGTGTPEVAIAAVGVALEMPRLLMAGFDPIGRTVHSQLNRSEKGHALGRVIDFEEFAQTLKFRHPTKSWVRDTFEPAWLARLRGETFVLAWDPVDYPSELRLVTAGDRFAAPHIAGTYCDYLEFDVSGAIL